MARRRTRRQHKRAAPRILAGRLRLAALLAVLLIVGGGAGVLLGLHVRDAIADGRSSSAAVPRAPRMGPAPDPAATALVRPTGPAACMGPCVDRELGRSWASAREIEDPARCAALPEALVAGCQDYAREKGGGQ